MKFIFSILFTLVLTLSNAQEINELINLGRDVNTGFHEAGPVISPDGKTLYFFVHNHPDNTYGKEGSQDIWFSQWDDAKKTWGKAQHMPSPLNNHRSNQVFTAFADNRTLLIRGEKSKNKKGFSFVYKNGSKWDNVVPLEIQDLKKMNVGKFYGATMSSDKKVVILYFSEKENSPASDLYVSYLQSGNVYSRPEKLPKNINTSRDEFGPFIAPDDKTMYYSSNRKDIGIGSADVYRVERLDDTWKNWSEPVNMGAPVNTRGFDAYFSIDAKGNIFTTSAGRSIDGGNLDIYGLKPVPPKLIIKGLVMDKKNEASIPASIMVKAVKNKLDTTLLTTEDGDYSFVLKKADAITFEVSAKGYKTVIRDLKTPNIKKDTTILEDFLLEAVAIRPMVSVTLYNKKDNSKIDGKVVFKEKGETISTQKTVDGYTEITLDKKESLTIVGSAKDYINEETQVELTKLEDPVFEAIELYLEPIEVGLSVRLNNIFFDFDKATLKPESYPELDKVVTFLNDYPSIQIEIEGHTDSKGSDEYNLNLSQERASAVRAYVVEQGISAQRISAQGFGENKPVASNDTEKGRAENRRVVFTIKSK